MLHVKSRYVFKLCLFVLTCTKKVAHYSLTFDAIDLGLLVKNF